jgi:hypothetical protein
MSEVEGTQRQQPLRDNENVPAWPEHFASCMILQKSDLAEAGLESLADSGGNMGVSQQGGAESGAVGRIDAELAVVVRAWGGLPDDVRNSILKLVETATGLVKR